MIVLVVRYYVQAGKVDVVEAALQRMAGLVKEQEPGCALYQVCRSSEDPRLFLLYEQYEDQAAFDAHRETPHFKEIIEGTVRPLVERRERELYTLVAG